jgi:hypothetical protein
LRELDAAKQEWAADTGQLPTATPNTHALRQYIGHGLNADLPTCPAYSGTGFDASYTINNVITPPVCNILPQTHVLVQ